MPGELVKGLPQIGLKTYFETAPYEVWSPSNEMSTAPLHSY